jgi:hypothetical protein
MAEMQDVAVHQAEHHLHYSLHSPCQIISLNNMRQCLTLSKEVLVVYWRSSAVLQPANLGTTAPDSLALCGVLSFITSKIDGYM